MEYRYCVEYILNGEEKEIELTAASPSDASDACFAMFEGDGEYEEINIIDLGMAYTETDFEQYAEMLEEQGYTCMYDDDKACFEFEKDEEVISVYDKPYFDGFEYYTDWHVVVEGMLNIFDL